VVDDVVDVVWLREITITARSAILAITVTTTRDEEPFEDVVLFAVVAAGLATGAAFAGGVVEIAATVRAGVAADAEMRLDAADFFATFFAGAFFATFLAGAFLAGAFFAATFLAGDFLAAAFFAGAFLATFFTAAFLATRFAATFFAGFLAGAFLATFFALFFTATVGLLDLAVGLAVGKEYFSDA
jgi:hypothetical protein